ncbi:MAG: hypothetical protein NTY22_06900 [Proteobacteria bacterium]|nr:hypothetical protein [Pseudomonadota bacterium]
MIRRITLLLLFLSILIPGYVYSSTSFSTDFRMGFSVLNSEGLNKITEGLDAGYGTTFGHIRVPLALSGGLSIGFSRSKIGLELGYEFANRSSYSSIYAVSENIKYSTFPLGIKYSYNFYARGKWSLWGNLSTGIMWVWFSMNTQPSVVVGNSSFETGASAWYLSPSVEMVYSMTKNIGFSALLGGRYADTSKFKYNASDNRHANGDFVTFSDGSNLTMNISGLKFLIGIILSWS